MASKKLGIIGGMGARASSQFLQKLIEYSPALSDQEQLEIILHSNSRIPDRTKAILYSKDSPLPEMLRSVKIFNENQVEVIVLACITAHYFYDQLLQHTNATILHPVQMVGEYLVKNHLHVRKVGILATTGTLKSALFHRELEKRGLTLVTLNEEDQERYFMQSVYMEYGLKSARISEEALDLFGKCIPPLLEAGAEIIIGGCSEVQIALNQKQVEMPFVDAIDLLAQETVHYCYN